MRDGFGLDFLSPEIPMTSPEKMPKIYLISVYSKETYTDNASTSHGLEG